MGRSRSSGSGDEYDDFEIEELVDALGEAFDGGGGGGDTAGLVVDAQIEWAGTIDNNGNGGVRRVRLDPIRVDGIREAVNEARPLKSYRANSWKAQYRQLSKTARGRELLTEAGVLPSRETLRRWNLGTQNPSADNQDRIAEAYESARYRGQDPGTAGRRAADELTRELRREYGVNVRFRDIRSIRFRR